MTPARVKQIRASARMTQAEFARAVGTSARAVQNWEGGQRTPRGPAVKILEQIEAKAAERAAR